METNDLKIDTFMYLISNKGMSNELIVSSLIISYYFDKCINRHNDKLKPLVSKSFLKECSSLLCFYSDNKNIESLNYLQRINLIRGKLAHGDFVIAPNEESIIIETDINKEKVEIEIPIKSISEFANHFAKCSRYPKSSEKRTTYYYKDGLEIKIVDSPKKKFDRNKQYETRFNHVVNKVILPNCGFSKELLEHKKDVFGMFNITVHVRGADTLEKYVNEYPNRKMVEWGLLHRLNYPQYHNHVCDDFINALIIFYKYYIYPLENFLKGEDKNAMSLLNDDMFGFEKLNISNELVKDVPYVGKVDGYIDSQSAIYDKINNLYDEFVEVENDDNNPYYDNTERKNKIEKKLTPYIDIISNPSIVRLYSYGKNRSFIEHLRCAIEHGNYDYDYNSGNITFTDSWQDKYYEGNLSIYDLYTLFSKKNRDLILNQFVTVYNVEEYVRTRKL